MNVADCQYDVIRVAARELGFRLSTNPEGVDWDVYWTDNHIDGELLMKMCQHQKVSHFPGIEHMTRKNTLGRTLMRMRKAFPEDFDFFPLTWMLPAEYNEFRLYYESKPKGRARTYIAKPEAGCQGKGIFLTRAIEDVENGRHLVVQRYLTKPLLI
jgi:tubulin polyglutamylase TTLL6/13